MPPLVRRRTFWTRLRALLDLNDLLLWLSEELNDDSYDEILDQAAAPLAISCNVLFILLRIVGGSNQQEDVFGPVNGRKRLFTWLVSYLVVSSMHADADSAPCC